MFIQNQNQIFLRDDGGVVGPAPTEEFRITEEDEQRITESGEDRIIE